MRLHTRDQAREGQAPKPKEQKPVRLAINHGHHEPSYAAIYSLLLLTCCFLIFTIMQWTPTKESYLRFLIESKSVYEAFEDIMANSPNTTYRAFVNTGLERTEALQKDIDYMVKTWGLTAGPPRPGGPGYAYAGFLRNLAASSSPAFVCHYYNFYFAHTAGGRMIGAQVSKMALDMWMGDFYKWDGEVSQIVEGVRGKINGVADEWSREDKDACLRETARTFKYSGGLLKELAGGNAGH